MEFISPVPQKVKNGLKASKIYILMDGKKLYLISCMANSFNLQNQIVPKYLFISNL